MAVCFYFLLESFRVIYFFVSACDTYDFIDSLSVRRNRTLGSWTRRWHQNLGQQLYNLFEEGECCMHCSAVVVAFSCTIVSVPYSRPSRNNPLNEKVHTILEKSMETLTGKGPAPGRLPVNQWCCPRLINYTKAWAPFVLRTFGQKIANHVLMLLLCNITLLTWSVCTFVDNSNIDTEKKKVVLKMQGWRVLMTPRHLGHFKYFHQHWKECWPLLHVSPCQPFS